MFLYTKWLALPLPQRQVIAKQFGISKTGPTHVQDNRVVSDGYSVFDIENALTVTKIQEFTGSKSDNLVDLWSALMEKITIPEVKVVPVENVAKAESDAKPEKEKTPEQIKRIEATLEKPAKKTPAKRGRKKTRA